MSDHFLLTSRRKIAVSVHQILDDHRHFDDKFKLLRLLFVAHLKLVRVFVKTDDAFFLCPCQRFFKFSFIINTFRHTPDDLNLVDRFNPHAQIRLDKVRIND